MAAQRPPGQRLPSFRPYHGRRPQLVLWLIIGLALVATSVIVFAALGAYFLFRGGKAAFSEGLVRSMPKDVWICDNYTSARSLTLQLAPGGARYQVQFECPESPAALDSDYVSELESLLGEPDGVDRALDLVRRSGAVDAVRGRAASLAAEALGQLERIPDSRPRRDLEAIAQLAVQRRA